MSCSLVVGTPVLTKDVAGFVQYVENLFQIILIDLVGIDGSYQCQSIVDPDHAVCRLRRIVRQCQVILCDRSVVITERIEYISSVIRIDVRFGEAQEAELVEFILLFLVVLDHVPVAVVGKQEDAHEDHEQYPYSDYDSFCDPHINLFALH